MSIFQSAIPFSPRHGSGRYTIRRRNHSGSRCAGTDAGQACTKRPAGTGQTATPVQRRVKLRAEVPGYRIQSARSSTDSPRTGSSVVPRRVSHSRNRRPARQVRCRYGSRLDLPGGVDLGDQLAGRVCDQGPDVPPVGASVLGGPDRQFAVLGDLPGVAVRGDAWEIDEAERCRAAMVRAVTSCDVPACRRAEL